MARNVCLDCGYFLNCKLASEHLTYCEKYVKANKTIKKIERKDEKMLTNFNGTPEDLSMILVSAERYALGRRTYIVGWTCEIIKKNLHLLSEKDKKVMIRDLENPISYGDECDKQEWMILLEKLRKE